jgi:hypothetical protein
MCRSRIEAVNPLFSLWRALWRPTAPASHTKSRQRNLASPIIFLFIHNHLTLRKWCYTRLQHDFALDPIISPFEIHFQTFVIWLRESYDYRNVSWEMICIYKRGNVPIQNWSGKSAVFLMESALTSHGSSKSYKKPPEESRTRLEHDERFILLSIHTF